MVAHAEQADLVPGLRLERVLGRGAHSVVWSATSLSDAMPWGAARSLVVKLALDSSARSSGLLQREARVLARLRAPNIVRLWLSGTSDDGRVFLVLSGASEGTLEERLRHGPLALAESLRLARAHPPEVTP